MPNKPVIRLREEILSFPHARESVRAEIRRIMQLRKFPLEAIGTFEQAASLQSGIPLEEARQFFDIEFTP
jgi:hypothetical protein